MPTSNRRTFVKSLAAAGIGAGTLPLSAPYWIPKRKSPDKLGIALVGLGYYSTDLLAPALQETSHSYLAGIVTGTPEKATRWKAEYNIPDKNVYNYENFDEIATNSDIDIIYVVLPNSMHAEYTIRAAKAGKHVICEKPMASNADECRAMIAACKEAGVQLSIGYRMQYEPTTQELIRIGADRDFGGVRMVTAAAGYREGRPNTWKLKKAMAGGAMMDMGVYSLQAARYATGEEPVTVSAQTFTNRPELYSEVDETTTFQLTFPSGTIANLQTSHFMGLNTLDVRYERGWARLEPFQAYRGIRGTSSRGTLNYPVVNQQAAQMDEDSLSIMEGKPIRVPGEEGLRDMIIVDAIYQSIADNGRTITL